ncbi:MAG: O-antigen ligase family protein [Bacteroidetes bacterium]|nr:O-antigen ligase family protein [Bacteroidota bacterium]
MFPAILNNEKWLLKTYLGLLFLGIGLFLFTGSYSFFLIPFALLYIVTAAINWRAAWWILLCCIPLSVQMSLQEGSLALSLPDEPMMWLFFLLFFVLFTAKPTIIPGWWLRDPLVIIVALQLLWLIVAVICSRVLFLSLKFLFAKCWYLICFMVFPLWIFRDRKDFVKAFLVLFVPLVVTICIIFIRQWVTHFSFREVNRAIGSIYYNHVEYSAVVSMCLPLAFVAWLLSKGRPKRVRYCLLALNIFLLLAVIFSYARAAMLAVIFAAVVALAIRLRLVNLIMPCLYGIIAMGMVYLVSNNNYIDLRPNYERTYMHRNFSDHLIATFKGQDMSSMERLYRWIAAVRMSNDRPIVGYGPHAFYYYYKPYTVNMFKTYVSRNEEHSTTHNYFLFMLVEQGWPAMLLYALLVMAVFAHAQRTYFSFRDRFYKYCTLGIAMAFAACFINNFFSEMIETHKVGSLFYIFIALLVILRQKSKEMTALEKAS